MNTEQAKRYIALKTRRSALEGEVDTIKTEMDGLETAILDQMASEGIQSIAVENYTLFPHVQRWLKRAEGISVQQSCDALKEAGLGDFVAENWSVQTVSAWYRERVKDNLPIPPAILSAFTATEVPKLGARKREA